MEGRKLLVALAIKYNGDFDKMLKAIKEKERLTETQVKKSLKKIKGFNYITILDSDYPDAFKKAYKPPLVLFYKGNIKLLSQEKILGVIGTRDPSDYGKAITTKMVEESTSINPNIVVLTGLSRGVSRTATEGALRMGSKVIAILPCGINRCYPSQNQDIYTKVEKSGGLLISEYPGDVDPNPDNFVARNRLIAGLSKSVLVAETKVNSGCMITAAMALQNDKDVLVIPHDITRGNVLNNRLIRDGGFIVSNSEDIVSSLNK